MAPRPLSPGPAIVAAPVVELWGDPRQIGTAHGQRLGNAIRMLHDQYLAPMMQGELGSFEARFEAAAFEMYMLPEHRAELGALGEAAGINHFDAVLGQCFLDLMPMTACSTIALPASASADGVARLGRNLDFPSLQIADKHTVLFIYHPNRRYQFATVGWPGMIGVLSGMNERGLCLACMEVAREARPASAMPYTLLYRTVLEQCKDVDEAIALLNRTPRQTANNLMLMDADGNRAVAEIRPQGVVIRRGLPDAALISTNHQRGQDNDMPGYCWRYDALHAASAAKFGHINAAALQGFLGQVVQGDRGDMTLQSMVFEPANRVLYLAAGADAPSRGYERIDLKPYFVRERGSAGAWGQNCVILATIR
jgi:hypothetical protein